MHEHDVSHLVVVSTGFPVGVISSLDVARAARAEAAARRRAQTAAAPPWTW
jgi:CBS domain-containing protein